MINVIEIIFKLYFIGKQEQLKSLLDLYTKLLR